jgi:S1-C subfamily serine protease
VKRAALAVSMALVLGACVPSQARDQISQNEDRIAALEAALAEATSTTIPADGTIAVPTTLASTDVTMLDLPDSVEPVALIAEAVGPAVVQIETGPSLGSGVLFSTDGYIITAHHVVEGFDEVLVRLYDGRTREGAVLGFHEVTDIAVIQIPADPDLPTAPLALGADIRVGQLAVALGSPFGFDQTVTAGIVSAVDRVVRNVTMVQTDAAINPGNSGGPLVNADGQVIGINDIIFTESGDNAGVGFAVSIDLAWVVAEQIIAGVESPQLAFLGVAVSDVGGDTPGARVEEVVAGSGAEAAGLEIGDVITAVNGVALTESADLRVRIIEQAPGDTITLTVIRADETLSILATLGDTSQSQ